jgi:hypothetical protein
MTVGLPADLSDLSDHTTLSVNSQDQFSFLTVHSGQTRAVLPPQKKYSTLKT